jgi:hypothetical protein
LRYLSLPAFAIREWLLVQAFSVQDQPAAGNTLKSKVSW